MTENNPPAAYFGWNGRLWYGFISRLYEPRTITSAASRGLQLCLIVKERTSSYLNSPQSSVGRCKMIPNPQIITNLFSIWILFSDVIKSPTKWISGRGCVTLKCYWISVLCGIARDQAKWFCLVVIVTACCVRSFFVFLWLSYSLCHSFTFHSI